MKNKLIGVTLFVLGVLLVYVFFKTTDLGLKVLCVLLYIAAAITSFVLSMSQEDND